MSIDQAPESYGSGARARFRAWRRTRPFWGGVIAIVGGIELYTVTAAPMAVMVMQGLPGLATLTIALLAVILGVITWTQPHLRTITGWVIIVMGIISILVSNLGGFLFGMILMVVGGSMILAWQPAPEQYDDYDGYDDGDYTDDAEYTDAEYTDDAEYDDGEYEDAPVVEQDGGADGRSKVLNEAADSPAGPAGRRSEKPGGGVSIVTDLIRRHGWSGVRRFVKGRRPDADRGDDRQARRAGTHGPAFRALTAGVVPVLLLTVAGQFAVAGPAAAAAAGGTSTSSAPDWWPFEWDPFPDDPATPAEPIPAKPTPAKPTPAKPTPAKPTPAKPGPATPATPSPEGGGLQDPPPNVDIPGIPLPPETPDANTPEELAAAEAAAKAAAAKACDVTKYPDVLPTLGSTAAAQAAAMFHNCAVAQVRSDNVPTPVTTADGAVTVSETSVLKASQLTMNGFAYDGVKTLQTRTGKVRVLAFSLDTLDVEGMDQTYQFPGGATRIQNTGNAVIKGNVKLYVTSMSGKAFGLIPLTFSPDQPPPLVVPFLLFTDTTSVVALVQADTILLPKSRITVGSAA